MSLYLNTRRVHSNASSWARAATTMMMMMSGSAPDNLSACPSERVNIQPPREMGADAFKRRSEIPLSHLVSLSPGISYERIFDSRRRVFPRRPGSHRAGRLSRSAPHPAVSARRTEAGFFPSSCRFREGVTHTALSCCSERRQAGDFPLPPMPLVTPPPTSSL